MEKDERRRGGKPTWWRRFWIEATIGSVVLCVVLFALYFSNYIDLYGLMRGAASIFLATFFAYVIGYIKIEVLSKNVLLKLYKVAFVAAGVSISIGITLFGVGITLRILNLPPLPELLGAWPAIILTAVIAPIIGGLFGYWLGKRRDFRPPSRKKG